MKSKCDDCPVIKKTGVLTPDPEDYISSYHKKLKSDFTKNSNIKMAENECFLSILMDRIRIIHVTKEINI